MRRFVLAVFLVGTTACGTPSTADVPFATTSLGDPEGRSILVEAAWCGGEDRPTVDETSEQIVVTLTVSGGERCDSYRTVRIPLAKELGSRHVVDSVGGHRFVPSDAGLLSVAFCGLDVLECGGPTATPSAAPSGGAAECAFSAYKEAVARDIDGGSYRISGERCDGDWAAFDVDFGVDACPAGDNSCAGKRVHRTFWRNEGGLWAIITYQGSGDCAEVWQVEDRFPEAICQPS